MSINWWIDWLIISMSSISSAMVQQQDFSFLLAHTLFWMNYITRVDCAAAPDPDLQQTAMYPSGERRLKCIIKPSRYSQMTERTWEFSLESRYVFRINRAATDFSKGVADVLERRQAWLALYCISWRGFLAFFTCLENYFKTPGLS